MTESKPDDLSDLSPEDRDLAKMLPRMDNIRASLRQAGDFRRLAEVEGWFADHAPVIRRIRDRLEPEF